RGVMPESPAQSVLQAEVNAGVDQKVETSLIRTFPGMIRTIGAPQITKRSDYFNVGNTTTVENPRYRRVPNGPTYCNIYVHDVTRALWSSIPHWVQARGQWH